MPIYEYQCDNCHHHLEVMQKISDEPLRTCPNCHQPQLKKRVSLTSFKLKGGGCYATDYKSKDSAISSQQAGDKSADKSEAKSEDKAATSHSAAAKSNDGGGQSEKKVND